MNREHAQRVVEHLEKQTVIPQLEEWQFQLDTYTDCYCPGLYLRCVSIEQREAIMRVLGWRPDAALEVLAGAEQ